MKSVVAVADDGAPVALEGRLAILDFIHGTGRERIYALVSGNGTYRSLAEWGTDHPVAEHDHGRGPRVR